MCGPLAGDVQNLKALYRRGQAHAALQQHQQAQADLQRSLELSGHDPKQQQLIREKLRAVEGKLAEVQQQPAAVTDSPAAAGVGENSEQTSVQQQQDAEDGKIEEIVDARPTRQQQQSDDEDYAGMPVLEEVDAEQPSHQQGRQQQSPNSSRSSQQQAATGNSSNISSMPGYDGLSASERARMGQMADMMRANPGLAYQVRKQLM